MFTGSLFVELLRMLQFFARFEVDELTGAAITEQESLKTYVLLPSFLSQQMYYRRYEKVTALQKAAFKHYREEMKEFYLLNVASIDSRRALHKHLSNLKFVAPRTWH